LPVSSINLHGQTSLPMAPNRSGRYGSEPRQPALYVAQRCQGSWSDHATQVLSPLLGPLVDTRGSDRAVGLCCDGVARVDGGDGCVSAAECRDRLLTLLTGWHGQAKRGTSKACPCRRLISTGKQVCPWHPIAVDATDQNRDSLPFTSRSDVKGHGAVMQRGHYRPRLDRSLTLAVLIGASDFVALVLLVLTAGTVVLVWRRAVTDG